MQDRDAISGYRYDHARPKQAHGYLLPALAAILDDFERDHAGRRAIDVGCGNGAVTAVIAARGYDVVGIDPSTEGVAIARSAFPSLRIDQASAYEDLAGRYGRFDVVVSLEVVEHLYDPRTYAATVFSLVGPGGIAVLSTPYHGYLKNLALAASGRLDRHFTALWDHGHIKFWSIATLTTLLREAGFDDLRFQRVGRVPPLAKSMIVVARRPIGR